MEHQDSHIDLNSNAELLQHGQLIQFWSPNSNSINNNNLMAWWSPCLHFMIFRSVTAMTSNQIQCYMTEFRLFLSNLLSDASRWRPQKYHRALSCSERCQIYTASYHSRSPTGQRTVSWSHHFTTLQYLASAILRHLTYYATLYFHWSLLINRGASM